MDIVSPFEGLTPEPQSMFVNGDDVYIVGHLRNGILKKNDKDAFVWKNGVVSKLIGKDGYNEAYANSVFVHNGDVYVAGTLEDTTKEPYQMMPCYWKNGERFDLPVSDGNWGYTTGIAIDKNGDRYLSGRLKNKAGTFFVVYWKNENFYSVDMLSTGDIAEAITVYNGAPYMVGLTVTDYWASIMWKDKKATLLPMMDPPCLGSAEDIVVDSTGTTYVAGYIGIKYPGGGLANLATIWKNGKYSILPGTGEVNEGHAFSVFLDGKDLYAGGKTGNDASSHFACYWKNGVRIDLDPTWESIRKIVVK